MRRIFGVVAVLAIAALFWWQYSERRAAERQLGLHASKIVSATFSRAAALKVADLNGEVTAKADNDGWVFDTTQTSTMPYSVDYFVDLSRLGPNSYRWDGGSETLTIDVPDITVADPNIDEARAVTTQGGIVITRSAGRVLAKQTSERAQQRARAEARHPKHADQARANARGVIATLVEGPLSAAGLSSVRVAVSFPWEPKTGLGPPEERWDVSRPMKDVLDERKNQAR